MKTKVSTIAALVCLVMAIGCGDPHQDLLAEINDSRTHDARLEQLKSSREYPPSVTNAATRAIFARLSTQDERRRFLNVIEKDSQLFAQVVGEMKRHARVQFDDAVSQADRWQAFTNTFAVKKTVGAVEADNVVYRLPEMNALRREILQAIVASSLADRTPAGEGNDDLSIARMLSAQLGVTAYEIDAAMLRGGVTHMYQLEGMFYRSLHRESKISAEVDLLRRQNLTNAFHQFLAAGPAVSQVWRLATDERLPRQMRDRATEVAVEMEYQPENLRMARRRSLHAPALVATIDRRLEWVSTNRAPSPLMVMKGRLARLEQEEAENPLPAVRNSDNLNEFDISELRKLNIEKLREKISHYRGDNEPMYQVDGRVFRGGREVAQGDDWNLESEAD